MNQTDVQRTSRFFDGYATDFDAIYGNSNSTFQAIINRVFRKSMMERFRLSIEGCAPVRGSSVLDVGCGPGHYSVELARRGAAQVVGIDVAPGMLEIACRYARSNGVENVCSFEQSDFLAWPSEPKFDYVILMGFMDYMRDAKQVVEKAVSLARRRAFFSFPLDGGLLAWQRKIRYRSRCELFMYTPAKVRELFAPLRGARASIRSAYRDLFVTAEIIGS